MLGAIFERFEKQSPISVMVRGLMERVFAPETIDRIFEENASSQYTRELLFSSLVELMSLVVCGIHPSVNAAMVWEKLMLDCLITIWLTKYKALIEE